MIRYQHNLHLLVRNKALRIWKGVTIHHACKWLHSTFKIFILPGNTGEFKFSRVAIKHIHWSLMPRIRYLFFWFKRLFESRKCSAHSSTYYRRIKYFECHTLFSIHSNTKDFSPTHEILWLVLRWLLLSRRTIPSLTTRKVRWSGT